MINIRVIAEVIIIVIIIIIEIRKVITPLKEEKIKISIEIKSLREILV